MFLSRSGFKANGWSTKCPRRVFRASSTIPSQFWTIVDPSRRKISKQIVMLEFIHTIVLNAPALACFILIDGSKESYDMELSDLQSYSKALYIERSTLGNPTYSEGSIVMLSMTNLWTIFYSINLLPILMWQPLWIPFRFQMKY